MMRVHGGRVYEYAEAHDAAWSEIADFSANINPLGPPPAVLRAVTGSLGQIRHYPDARHQAVKRVLSQRFGVEPERIVCGNGATEALALLLEALRPQRLMVLTPAFQGYEATARHLHIPVLKVPLWQDGGVAFSQLTLVQSLQCGDAVIVNNPHNPTGYAFTARELAELAEVLQERGVHLIVDESFMDFLPDQERWSVLPLTRKIASLSVLRSATKMYAIPGLRFGFAVCAADLAAQIERVRDGWSVNQLAQVAAVAAYQGVGFDEQTWTWLKEETSWLYTTWGRHSLIELQPPHANFFLVQIKQGGLARKLLRHLEQQRVYLRGMAGFELLDDTFLRVAIQTRGQNERLWRAVEGFVAATAQAKE